LVGVNMTADVVFTRAKVAVFVDGCFWHGCPEHYRKPAINKDYWEPKLLKNMARPRLVVLDVGPGDVGDRGHFGCLLGQERCETTQ